MLIDIIPPVKKLPIQKILLFSVFLNFGFCLFSHADDSFTFGGAKGAEVMSLWKEGKKSEAEGAVHRWMDEKKKSPEPWVFAAILEFEKEKYKHCVSYCDKAIEKGPQTAQAYYWKGRALEALKKYLEAANEYRAALVIQKDYSDASVRLKGVQIILDGNSSQPTGK